VTIQIRLILYSSCITPIISSPQPPLKAIARGFFVLFHIGTRSPSTICYHFNLPHSPSLSTWTPLHCTYFTILSFVINNEVDTQRGLSKYHCCGKTFFFYSFQYTSLYLLLSQMLYLAYYWLFITPFFFPSFPKFHEVQQLCTYSIYEFVYDHACFVYMFIF
jgi:hypothetical protein